VEKHCSLKGGGTRSGNWIANEEGASTLVEATSIIVRGGIWIFVMQIVLTSDNIAFMLTGNRDEFIN
jgi:hypothetical protein